MIDFTEPNDDNHGRIYYHLGSNYMTFDTDSTERMRINSSGNVGIGTNSPSSKLHVNGTVTATTFSGNLTGNVTGSASTLTTARTIGGVSFDGSANINLPGVNAEGNQNTTGSAATLTTARTIGGVSFDGSANINLPGVNTTGTQNTSGNAATATVSTNVTVSANNSTDETTYLTFVDGATGTQGIETDTGLTYNPNSGKLTTVVVSTDTISEKTADGGVTVDGVLLKDNKLRLGTSTNNTTLQSANSGGALNLTLPSSAGSSGQYLKTDGSGNLSWSTVTGNDSINEGNTTVETVDTGSDGHIKFSTEGSERIRIDSSGRTGFNVSSPTNFIDINHAGGPNGASSTRSGTHPTDCPLYVTTGNHGDSDGVEFRHNNGSQGIGFGYNTIYATGTNTDQHLNLKPRGSGGVGIGTVAPDDSKLHIKGTVNALRLENSGTSGGNYFVSSTASDWTVGSNKFVIGSGSLTSNNVKFVMDSTGKIGLGTATPSTYLVVGEDGGGHSTTTPGIHMKSTSSETKHYTVGQASDRNVFLKWQYNSTASSAYASLSTYAGGNSLSLQSDGGNVGIGTVSPSEALDVVGNINSSGNVNVSGGLNVLNSAPTIILKDTTDDDDFRIYFQNNSSSTLYSIDGTGDTFNIETNVSRELKLRTNDTDALVIDTSQNVRIGTTTNDSANVSGKLAIIANNSTTTDLEFRTDDTTTNSQDYPTAKIESGFDTNSLEYCIY